MLRHERHRNTHALQGADPMAFGRRVAFAVRKVHLEITDHGDMARRDQEAREVAGSVIGVRRYTTHVHEDCIGRVDINPVFVISGAVPVRNRRSEEHTSELQSLMRISSAVFCLKKTTIKLEQYRY